MVILLLTLFVSEKGMPRMPKTERPLPGRIATNLHFFCDPV